MRRVRHTAQVTLVKFGLAALGRLDKIRCTVARCACHTRLAALGPLPHTVLAALGEIGCIWARGVCSLCVGKSGREIPPKKR